MPAAQAGLKTGDVITSIDGWTIEGLDDVARIVGASSGRTLAVEVSRDGKTLPFSITPDMKEHRDDLGVTVRIGDIGIRHLIPPVVGEVISGMPASKAGFEAGDRIKAIDGKPINSFDDLIDMVGPSAGKLLTFTVDRGGDPVTLEVTPESTPQKSADGTMTQRGRIGLAPKRPEAIPANPIEAVRLGIRETYANLGQTVTGIWDIITQRQSADQMGGPILMAEVTARVVELGIEPLLKWTALISANIGLLNLLPIPVLDGGHLVFYAIEAIRRRPLSQRVQEIGFQIGMVLVMMLVVFVNLNDLVRLGKRWLFGGG